MQYEGNMYRPPSEANSYILQATIGCSHNLCTYCDMYRSKKFRVKKLEDSLRDLQKARKILGSGVEKIFVADGDALVLEMPYWSAILKAAHEHFPNLRRVSCYATALNINEKTDDELAQLQKAGLDLLYIGPESGDPLTMKRIVKGATHEEHVEAAEKVRRAGMSTSIIVLLGAGGVERTEEHASETARLITGMDPTFLSALTLTVLPNTPIWKLQKKGRFELPDQKGLLRELYTIVAESRPSNAIFRTNHASNYLPLSGRLPSDRKQILGVLEQALDGKIPLRPEWSRGL